MSGPSSGDEPNFAEERWPGGEPGWGPSQGRPPGYGPAPGWSGPPDGYGGAGSGRRPGGVTAAGVVGIVWGALALLFGLLAVGVAFAVSGLLGLTVLIAVVVGVGLLVGGIRVVTGRSPRLLLYISYAAVAINLVELAISLAQNGPNAFNGVLGFVLPGVIVALLLQPPAKQYYASRGLTY